MITRRNTKGASHWWPIVVALGLSVGFAVASEAALTDEQRRIQLSDSIYMTLSDDPALLDRDLDGLKDDYENRLADTWRPYFIFDQHENARQQCHDVVTGVETVLDTACVAAGCAAAAGIGCALDSVRDAIKSSCKILKNLIETVCKGNVDDDSLQPFEPVVIFQVRPIAGNDWPRRIKIQYVFLYRLDGGYRTSNVCTNYHYGDTQSGSYELSSYDGVNWSLDSLDLWGSGREEANSSAIEWTEPRDTYWGQMPKRPSPVIYASAGKHHQYISAQACEDEPGACDDDCGGGAHRLANLAPKGTFTNVGEYQAHPSDVGVNNPFVSDLGPLGYAGEQVWKATYSCHCPLATTAQECFTGGTGNNWAASKPPQGCDAPTPVYKLLDLSVTPAPPPELGITLMFVLF